MDGNGRWAKQRNRSRIKGHKAAIPAVRTLVEACVDLGIEVLTVYAFSQENWKRPPYETGALMALLRQFLRIEKRTVETHQLRIRVLGDKSALSAGIQKDICDLEAFSQHNEGLHFNIAINYSGRADILQAYRRAIQSGINPENVSDSDIDRFLFTAPDPEPDLIVRTSGECRISNFLLWQCAYSEFWVTPTLWPDFTKETLYRGLVEYQTRDRRFGGV